VLPRTLCHMACMICLVIINGTPTTKVVGMRLLPF
jgi:hypothetical protein